MAFWLFQGNPKYYRILDGIRDFEQMPWLVTRYDKLIAPGDGVLVWMAGKDAGIYGIAEVVERPRHWEAVPDVGYWVDKSRLGQKPQVLIRFTSKLLDKPLLRSQLSQDPVLKTLMVMRQPNATNFKVTPEEWQRVFEVKQGC